jgi:serine/threonine-protein kinase
MKSVNPSDTANSPRSNAARDKQHEVANQKKKNTATYWLAGITSVLIIIIAIFISISLFMKDNTTTYQLGNYKGQEYEAVKTELEATGLKITPVWKDSDTLDKGIIIEQSIEPGTDYKGGNYTTLELTVSNGPKMVKVPDVKDREYRDAQNELESATLIVKPLVKDFNTEVPADYVIKTEPEGGKEVREGSEIIIYVSKGTELKKVKVPNLVGKTEIEAQKLLSDSKLVLGNILPVGTTKGIVNKQVPEAYQDLVEGDSVTIWLTPQETTPPADSTKEEDPGTGETPPSTSTTPASTSTETPVIP